MLKFTRRGHPDFIKLLHGEKDKQHTIRVNGNPNKLSFLRYNKRESRYEFGSLINGVDDVVDYMDCDILHNGMDSRERLITDFIEHTRAMILEDSNLE